MLALTYSFVKYKKSESVINKSRFVFQAHSKIETMIQEWRLLITEPSSGAWNMALDEAVLRHTADKKSPPTLRLFNWQPATLSLGFAQPISDVDFAALKSTGWGLVRRPTGGRAILHVDEITYSVTGPTDDPHLSGSLLESYRKISLALLAGLAEINIHAVNDKTYENQVSKNNPVCFETPSNYEITANGKKLIGSAQARKDGGLLQHGTLPLKGDITRVTRVLRFASERDRTDAAEKLKSRATTVEELLGNAPDWSTAAQAMIEGFRNELKIILIPGQPTDEESKLANELVNTRYGSDEWTFRI